MKTLIDCIAGLILIPFHMFGIVLPIWNFLEKNPMFVAFVIALIATIITII